MKPWNSENCERSLGVRKDIQFWDTQIVSIKYRLKIQELWEEKSAPIWFTGLVLHWRSEVHLWDETCDQRKKSVATKI